MKSFGLPSEHLIVFLLTSILIQTKSPVARLNRTRLAPRSYQFGPIVPHLACIGIDLRDCHHAKIEGTKLTPPSVILSSPLRVLSAKRAVHHCDASTAMPSGSSEICVTSFRPPITSLIGRGKLMLPCALVVRFSRK